MLEQQPFVPPPASPPPTPTPPPAPTVFQPPPPASPPAPLTPPSNFTPVGHSHLLVKVVVLAVGLGLIGGVAYAYMKQIGPFSVTQYAEASFISDVLAKAAGINSASYNLSMSFAVAPREAGATAFVVPAEDATLAFNYKLDAGRLSHAATVVGNLVRNYGEQKTYNYKTGTYTITRAARPYPVQPTLADLADYSGANLNLDESSSKLHTYTQTEGGKNFALTIPVETDAAINAIRQSYAYSATTTIISGQKMTFTKDSSTYFYLPSTLPKPFLASLADSLRSIPPDVSADVSVGATTDFRTEGLPDWRFDAAAKGDFGDLSYAVDVEALKKSGDYYIRVNKMPSLFTSLANYKGQWIVIDPAAASSTTSGYSYNEFSSIASGISKAETSYKKNRADFTNGLKNIAQIADTDKLIVFKSSPIKEKVDGRDLYRYELTLKKESIIPFYTDVLAESDKTSPLWLTKDQGLLDYLKSKDFDDIYAYVEKNTFLTLWTDTSGFPAILEYRMRVVPPDTAVQLKDKQVDIVLKLVFSDINQSVKIDAPKDAKPIQTVIDEINKNSNSNFSPSSMNNTDTAIKSYLATIQTHAELYYVNHSNSYGTQAWVSGAATSCSSGMFTESTINAEIKVADSVNGTGKVACYAGGQDYLAGAGLTVANSWWCVDSRGTSKLEAGTVPSTALKTCP